MRPGADFAKTSTGFFTGGRCDGATTEVIEAMMDTARGRIKIKGSGGIRDQEHFFRLIDMGIDRMGIGFRSTPIVLGLGTDAKPRKSSTDLLSPSGNVTQDGNTA